MHSSLHMQFLTLLKLPCTSKTPHAARLHDIRGQATVEAVLTLPIVLILLALLIQPGLILYSHIAMQSCAVESCRLLGTWKLEGRHASDRFTEIVKRKLRAVPAINIFHMGGDEGWDIEFSTGSVPSVKISHEIKPLPLLSVLMRAFKEKGPRGGYVYSASCENRIRPHWVKGGYSDWTEALSF